MCAAWALLAAGVAPKLPPIMVRFAPDPAADPASFDAVIAKQRDALRRAARIVVSDAAAHRRLLACGVGTVPVTRLSPAAYPTFDRDWESRRGVRRMFYESNHDLFTRAADRVVLCPGDLTRAWGIDMLVRAAAPLVERYSAMKLWILGDGRHRSVYYDLLRDYGVHRAVAMPGVVTEMELALQAADLCVLPAPGRGLEWLLPTCLVNAVPVMVADCDAARSLLGPDAERWTFPPNNHDELRRRLEDWWRNPDRWRDAMLDLRASLIASLSQPISCDDWFPCSHARR